MLSLLLRNVYSVQRKVAALRFLIVDSVLVVDMLIWSSLTFLARHVVVIWFVFKLSILRIRCFSLACHVVLIWTEFISLSLVVEENAGETRGVSQSCGNADVRRSLPLDLETIIWLSFANAERGSLLVFWEMPTSDGVWRRSLRFRLCQLACSLLVLGISAVHASL